LNPETGFTRIIDHYLPSTRLRLRRIESPGGEILQCKLGQKYQAEHLQSYQTIITNIYLDEAEYEILTTLGGTLLVKRRYPYLYAGEERSLDVFEGHLQGLILLEIERRPGSDIAGLTVPPFAIREVTGDPFFSGGQLAALPQEEFKAWLRSYYSAL
jgi:CYTH domain-containing protein